MPAPLVVSSFLPGERPYAGAYPTRSVQCRADSDYWRGLASVWDHDGPLVVIEHDMDWTDGLIAELLDCDQPLCTHAYTIYWVSTGQEAHYAHRAGALADAWIGEGDEWADYSGIGFCKIAPEARAMSLVDASTSRNGEVDDAWQHVDIAVNKAVRGRWHVHHPGVDHLHW